MGQKQRILDHLKSGKTLTRLNSWSELGVIEAPARITELRQEGYPINTEMRPVKNRYGETVRVAVWSMSQ